jgi:hypothetical protein
MADIDYVFAIFIKNGSNMDVNLMNKIRLKTKIARRISQEKNIPLIYLEDSLELQNALWEKWNFTDDETKFRSDAIALKIFGLKNEEVSNACMNYFNDTDQSTAVFSLNIDRGATTVVIDKHTEKRLRKAAFTSGIFLVYKADSFEEQMEVWNKWRTLNHNFKELSDKISMNISGVRNQDHHKALMSYWKEGLTDKEINLVKAESSKELFTLKGNIPILLESNTNREISLYKLSDLGKILILEEEDDKSFYKILDIDSLNLKNILSKEGLQESVKFLYSFFTTDDTLNPLTIEVKSYINEEGLYLHLYKNYLLVEGVNSKLTEFKNTYKILIEATSEPEFEDTVLQEHVYFDFTEIGKRTNHGLVRDVISALKRS